MLKNSKSKCNVIALATNLITLYHSLLRKSSTGKEILRNDSGNHGEAVAGANQVANQVANQGRGESGGESGQGLTGRRG